MFNKKSGDRFNNEWMRLQIKLTDKTIKSQIRNVKPN